MWGIKSLAGGLAAKQGCAGHPQPLSLQVVMGLSTCVQPSVANACRAPGLRQVQVLVGEVWVGAEPVLRGVAEQGSRQ